LSCGPSRTSASPGDPRAVAGRRSKSRTFAARIAFTSGKVPAELGQSARVFMQSADSVPLSVPLSALTAENGATYVWVVSANNTLKKTPVRIGPSARKACRCSKA
jgi:multidrug efflux system membrane fusion protein